MKTYFNLQWKIICRSMKDFGLPWLLIFPAIALVYIAFFYLLRQYPYWAAYLIFLLNFQALFSLAEYQRNDFLKMTFNNLDYYLIRILENLILSFGTVILLIIFGKLNLALVLLAIAVLFVFVSTNSLWSGTFPTPFRKYPFEFIIGFRRTWPLLIILYVLAYIGLAFGNQNLALFCMFCICICGTLYYQVIEPGIILWNQNRKPVAFLLHKFTRGIIQLSLLLLPIAIPLCVIFPEDITKALIVWGLGLFLIPFAICLKYAVFPRKVSVSESIVLGLCLAFYPLVLVIIPYYYYKAIQNLKSAA
ncbi:hypothetical protein [Sphingobacterium sp. NPDC055431]